MQMCELERRDLSVGAAGDAPLREYTPCKEGELCPISPDLALTSAELGSSLCVLSMNPR